MFCCRTGELLTAVELTETRPIVVSEAGTSAVFSENAWPDTTARLSWRVDWKPAAEMTRL